jgi:uncharacterized membrane protein
MSTQSAGNGRFVSGQWSGRSQDGGGGGSPHREERLEAPVVSTGDQQLANCLGWFSLGLGLAAIAAPGSLARLIGVQDSDANRSVLRLVGMREIASGVGILAEPRPSGWVWSRVAGDVMDLALLGSALNAEGNARGRLAAATAAVAGITAVDVMCGQQLSRSGETREHHTKDPLSHVKVMTINRPAETLYGFWRNFEHLPCFMRNLESVVDLGGGRSHWRTQGPAGRTVEWDAEITEDRPNELIAWRSVEGADVANSGRVLFKPAPGDRGTEVRVELHYSPPGGVLGARIAKLWGKEPGQQLQEDLRTFKQMMETGEMVRSDAVLGEPKLLQPAARPQENASRKAA